MIDDVILIPVADNWCGIEIKNNFKTVDFDEIKW
jgi:hypothetical protein